MNCKLAYITHRGSVDKGSPREYVTPPVATDHALELAAALVSAEGTGPFAVIDGETMEVEYIVFEGTVFEPRERGLDYE